MNNDSKFLLQFGIITDEIFVITDRYWSTLGETLPDLTSPLPMIKFSLGLILFSFLSSFIPFYLGCLIALVSLVVFILTFFDFKPKLWNGESSQRDYEHPWMTRLFLLWLIFSALLSSFLGEEYSNDLFIAHIVVIMYPFVAILGVIGLSAQAEMQSSFGHETRYLPTSRHED